MTRADNPMLHAALWYAELGYPVFPCAPGRKAPLTEHGLLEATTDAEQITEWWTQHPDANVAIRADGLVVIDIDGDGNAWLANEPDKLAGLDAAPLSLTPRGGRHYFFRQPEGRAWRSTAGRLAPRVDTRANGGYVLVAPSVVEGKPYRWQDERELSVPPQRLPEPPAWLIELLDALVAPSASACNGTPANSIPQGQRNETLARLGGAMRRVGMSQAEICAALRQVNADRCTPPLPLREVERTAASIARYEPDSVSVALVEDHWAQMQAASDCIATCLADVEPTEVRWLWPGRFARGKLSLIAGQPGLGKSFLTLDMAARVSRGDAWPLETDAPDRAPENVVLLSAEDDIADTIRPRLDAAGAAVERVYAVTTVPAGATLDGKPRFAPFRVTEHLPMLDRVIEQIGGCALVIIDPISAYLGKTDSHNNSEVRDALVPLAAFAAKHQAALAVVTHLNKSQQASALNAIIGSVAFVAAARAAYVVSRDPDDPRRRLFLPVKNNLGLDETGFAYRLGGGEPPSVEWEDDLVRLTADEAIAPTVRQGPEPMALRDAEEWLLDFLSAGARPASEVLSRGRADGHTVATLRRAKTTLKVDSVKTGKRGGWVWQLPGGGPLMQGGA
jgi:hypothetical protein